MNKLSLLKNTPVDLVYKYIDLNDPALNRTDSVRKDFDNNELRYSIRSALKNIPWIRYIYIIMPNERVSSLKSASWPRKHLANNDCHLARRSSSFLSPFSGRKRLRLIRRNR